MVQLRRKMERFSGFSAPLEEFERKVAVCFKRPKHFDFLGSDDPVVMRQFHNGVIEDCPLIVAPVRKEFWNLGRRRNFTGNRTYGGLRVPTHVVPVVEYVL